MFASNMKYFVSAVGVSSTASFLNRKGHFGQYSFSNPFDQQAKCDSITVSDGKCPHGHDDISEKPSEGGLSRDVNHSMIPVDPRWPPLYRLKNLIFPKYEGAYGGAVTESKKVKKAPPADWTEPMTGVKFPRNMEIPSKRLTKLNGEYDKMPDFDFTNTPLLAAGVRCMLGNSALCERIPHSRVYAYGMYVDNKTKRKNVPTCYTEEESEKAAQPVQELGFNESILDVEASNISWSQWLWGSDPRAVRMEVLVPKDGHHWAHGYFKVMLKQLKEDRRVHASKKRYEAAIEKLVKFCGIFASRPHVFQPGVVVIYTWIPGDGLAVIIDGETCGFIEGDDFARALFNVYFGHRGVNTKVSSMCRHQWAVRNQYPDAEIHQDPVRCEWNPENAPKEDPCVLRGYQWSELTFEEHPETGKLGHQKPFGESKGTKQGKYH